MLQSWLWQELQRSNSSHEQHGSQAVREIDTQVIETASCVIDQVCSLASCLEVMPLPCLWKSLPEFACFSTR
jgi:hypothetical protein